ncbi:MAG: hypothetical protein M1822_002745 [Bathelium mastoideum]|nr:MAG: hypothetical protein M1822_002745 [Bathelium mastoideum]
MESAGHRDKIATRKDVFGFEMEAAGLWDNVPVLDIRGICDYADTRKKKVWQRHAAVMVIAFVEASLQQWRVVEHNSEPAYVEETTKEAPQGANELMDMFPPANSMWLEQDAIQQSMSVGSHSNDGIRVFEIHGTLEGSSISALGDYGAKKNFMNESFARRIGLGINKNVVCSVPVGSGKVVQTAGEASAIFGFLNETTTHMLKFHLLPNCIHDVILGKHFLKATKTFSDQLNFLRRVKEKIVSSISQFHLLYLGDSSSRFEGFVEGISQTALADSGAKVLIVDEDWARRNGLTISSGRKHRARLRFADNSKAWTSGMAYGVNWRFDLQSGSTPHLIDFHVLKNAPAEVILYDTFLFDTCAFSKYQDCLLEIDDDDDSSCFAIDRDLKLRPEDDNVKPKLLDQLEIRELVRRGSEDDRILNLPKQDQEAAQSVEDKRRTEWDRHLAGLKHKQSDNSQPFSSSNNQSLPHTLSPSATPGSTVATSSSSPDAPGIPSSGSSGSRKRKRLKRLLRWKS